jgi:fumarate reductase subunit D
LIQLLILAYPYKAIEKKNASRPHHLKAFSFDTIGNLAVLTAAALDPWFCVAIFR